jgi:alpha-tubulin suppressor-like RCC1 family protein
LYALSASGKVYALATEAEKQRPPVKDSMLDSWWNINWFWGESQTVDFVEVTPKEALAWGEKYAICKCVVDTGRSLKFVSRFTSIDAGSDHLLAITSKHRTFVHPVNKNANAYGQLGLRKFEIPDPTVPHQLEVELIPKSIADPFVKSSRLSRPSPSPTISDNLVGIDDSNIRFCPRLFEIPVLKGVDVLQIAAGGRTSFVRTTTGRILGWGANEYG